MADDINTTKIRMVAQDVVAQQARVCEARRDNVLDRLKDLAQAAQANTRSVTELAKSVAVMAKTVEPLPTAIEDNEKNIDKLTRRPAFWAALGSALPVAAGVLWELIRNKP